MAEGGSGTPELLRLRIHGGKRFIRAVSSAAAGVAEGLDFGRDDVERVRSVVQSLCLDVIECHFDDPRQADFTLILGERRGALIVRIEDEGLPYSIGRFSLERETLVGRRHADDVRPRKEVQREEQPNREADALDRSFEQGLARHELEACEALGERVLQHRAEDDGPETGEPKVTAREARRSEVTRAHAGRGDQETRPEHGEPA